MKGRESGMPGEDLWSSFFDAACAVKALGIDASAGDIVEFGCGYGLFTLPAARLAKGMVFALDIESELVSETNEKARHAGLRNVEASVCDFMALGTGLPDESCGYAMLFNILHVENPLVLLHEAHRVLKWGGTAGVMHWISDRATPRGPSLEVRPAPCQIVAWAESVGFSAELVNLPCCPYHYGMKLRKH